MDVACHTKKLNTTLHSLHMTDALHFVCHCNGHKTSQNHMIFSHITVLATTDLYQINLLSTFKQHYITNHEYPCPMPNQQTIPNMYCFRSITTYIYIFRCQVQMDRWHHSTPGGCYTLCECHPNLDVNWACFLILKPIFVGRSPN